MARKHEAEIRPIDFALAVLGELEAQRWAELRELAHRHVTGALSFTGWKSATMTIVTQAGQSADPAWVGEPEKT